MTSGNADRGKPRHVKTSVLQRCDYPTFISARSLQGDQIDIGSLEFCNERIPRHRIIGHAQMLNAPARIEMRLGHVDTGIGPTLAIRYPTLRIQIHYWHLFGLHELEGDAPAR